MDDETQAHAFTDDVLGHHDAVGLAELLRRGEVSRREVLEATVARAHRVAALNALQVDALAEPIADPGADSSAPFAGVPFVIKDNIDVAGLPTRHGSTALPPRPARAHSKVTRMFLDQGLVVVGKSRLPEFGFSCSTEPAEGEPTRNPYNRAYSAGGSSGGSAALVAAGVVPIAHGNDGGGSIRIPASCCGLVGLKPTRGRLVDSEASRNLPLRIAQEGVLTRSVRDTAHFMAAAERDRPSRRLPPVGLVEGPGSKRLRIALVVDSINDNRSCDETRAVVERAARVLEGLGHRIEPLVPPVPSFFMEDFKLYWAFLAASVRRLGHRLFPGFRRESLDDLTNGLAAYHGRRFARTPLAMARLSTTSLAYTLQMRVRRFDAVLSPVLSHAVPKLGFLHPRVPFDTLFERIVKWTAFTPLNNAAGTPGLAMPAGLSRDGVPIGVHLSAAHGAERLLLELGYELEAELGRPRIDAPRTT